MREKQINGPAGIIAIVIVVVVAVGLGYWFLNKDTMGKEGEARKLNPPGVLSADYDPKSGPSPNEPGNLSKVQAGAPTSRGIGTPPAGVKPGGP